jgi:hypothetical protein
VGPTTSNPTSLAHPDVNTAVVTSGPSDQGYLDQRDFVQVLMTRPSNPPDVVSFHSYAGSGGSDDSDSALLAEPDASAIKDYRESIRPYVGTTPVWETETNDDASNFDQNDFRGVTQLDSAWLAHNFARMCAEVPQVRTLFQFEYSINNTFAIVAAGGPPGGCPDEAACKITAGRPLLPYWTINYLNRLIPRGSRLLKLSAVPSGFDVLAVAVPPDFSRVEALVVNDQVGSRPGLGAPGALNLQLAGGSSRATRQWAIDGNTNLVAGPAPESLGGTSSLRVNLSGYGAAFVEFRTTSSSPSALPNNGVPVGLVLAGLAAAAALGAGAWLFATRRVRP